MPTNPPTSKSNKLRLGNRLLAVLICSAGLTACNGMLFPTYTGSDADIRDKQLWTNMRDVQTAAEHYAANHGEDNYPKAIDNAFKSYLPGGGEDGENPRPVGLVNPYFGANEFPVMGSIRDIVAVRNGTVPSLRPGEIQYSSILGGKGYAIIGGGHDGKALRDYDGKVLVFTNFNDEELAEQAERH